MRRNFIVPVILLEKTKRQDDLGGKMHLHTKDSGLSPLFRRYALVLLWAIGSMWGSGVAWADESHGVVKFNANLRLNQLGSRPDSDLVELSDGKRVRIGELRRMDLAAKKLRSAPATAIVPQGLRFKPAATGIPVKKPSDLAAALKRPDSDTVILPSGRRVTVGQLRFVQPRLEAQLGWPLGAPPKRPTTSGVALKVTAESDWKAILKRPDDTVLESPSGKRITVGELKAVIRKNKLPWRVAPAGKR